MRKAKKAVPKKPPTIPRYTEAELYSLHLIHCEIARVHMNDYTTHQALHQSVNGLVADIVAFPLLRLIAEIPGKIEVISDDEKDKAFHIIMSVVGQKVTQRIMEDDAEYFEQLAVVLRARGEGRKLYSLTRKELNIKVGAGRPPSVTDLATVFPLALWKVTLRRSRDPEYPPEVHAEFTDAKITRKELTKAIQDRQAKSGMSNPPPISKFKLSYWISEYAFGPFMAEQPIARKPRKKA